MVAWIAQDGDEAFAFEMLRLEVGEFGESRIEVEQFRKGGVIGRMVCLGLAIKGTPASHSKQEVLAQSPCSR